MRRRPLSSRELTAGRDRLPLINANSKSLTTHSTSLPRHAGAGSAGYGHPSASVRNGDLTSHGTPGQARTGYEHPSATVTMRPHLEDRLRTQTKTGNREPKDRQQATVHSKRKNRTTDDTDLTDFHRRLNPCESVRSVLSVVRFWFY